MPGEAEQSRSEEEIQLNGTKGQYPKRFLTDPIRLINGSIQESHPDIMERMINDAAELGVELIGNYEGNVAYAPGLFRGQPGQLHVNPNNSYLAWLHEYKHLQDDARDGWPGFRALRDVERSVRMEWDAYAIEIAYAEQNGYYGIAELLRRNRDTEIKRLRSGKDDYSKSD